MKTSNVFALSSFLLASLVAAAPLNRRDMVIVTKIEEVVETIDIYTTVWVDKIPSSVAAAATSTASSSIGGLFYEQPSVASSVVATSALASSTPVASPVVPSPSAPAYVAPPSSYVAPTSVYTPPAYTPPAYTPPAYTPPAYTPAPSSTETPTPVYTPAPSTPSASSYPSTGAPSDHYSGDITYYNPAGGYGSCGWTIQDSDPVVALAHGMMGEQSNGNPWCGKKIKILHNGKTFDASIGDKCGGCDGESIDLTQGLWEVVAPDVDGRGHDIEWWVVD